MRTSLGVIPADSRHAPPDAGAGTRRIRVMIADDHPFYRDQLAISLRRRGIEVIGEVPNGLSAIDLAETASPDVILMDLRMPLLSGLAATRRLAEVSPQRRIVAISAAALVDEVADAILWGADAYVAKERPPDELIAAIDEVASGRVLLPGGIAQVISRRVRGTADSGLSLIGAPLVRRELDLLNRLAAGETTAEIAIAMSAPEKEIADGVAAMVMKLRIEQRIQAAFRDAADPGKP